MKKILTFLLTLTMLTAALVSVNAATGVSGECGDLTWSIDYLNNNHDSTLTITGLGAIPDYTADTPAPWHEYREYIKFVNILGGVSGIGSYAFQDCSVITRFNLADSIKSFGDHAFDGCSALQSMYVPSSVTAIGKGAFYNCTSVTSVVLPNRIKMISDDLFYNCRKLEYTTISYNVTSIGNNAFYNCTSLKALELPNLTSIGENAFYGCTSLELDFKCEVPTFGENAFGGITATFYYPKNSRTWTESALQSYGGTITWVEKPYITHKGNFGDNITWTLDYYGYLTLSGTGDMFIWAGDASSVPWYGGTTTLTARSVDHVIIEEGITSIFSDAFKRCVNLESVSIPASVSTIDSSAFYGCNNLTDVYFAGTRKQWTAIDIASGNEPLQKAKLHIGTPSAPGDLDSNDAVDEVDVIHLLRHLLLPEAFSVDQSADYDNSGSVDEDDVIYLLQHLLMPEIFPL